MEFREVKLKISAIIVGFNESRLLAECFKGVNFCDEILYFDLGSSDGSLEIAKKNNVTIIKHDRVPLVEYIHAEYFKTTKNKWVLITDPDEVLGEPLRNEIFDFFNKEIPFDIGAINVPWCFYFKKHRLRGTQWGNVNKRVLLIHNDRFFLTTAVHNGRKLKDGFNHYDIIYNGSNFVHHYWMQDYKMLFEKHKRYLQYEGKSRYDNGYRTTLKFIFKTPFSSFFNCYYLKKGYKDYLIGFFLSLFWSWYETKANIELYKYQRKFYN
jgi:hypothetical protein